MLRSIERTSRNSIESIIIAYSSQVLKVKHKRVLTSISVGLPHRHSYGTNTTVSSLERTNEAKD